MLRAYITFILAYIMMNKKDCESLAGISTKNVKVNVTKETKDFSLGLYNTLFSSSNNKEQ